jgi:tetratricopeptide (TPR) repeat protein
MGVLTGLISGTWGEVLEGLAGMASGAAGLQPVKEMVNGARARAAGRLPLPENYDLVRGIRTAYLTALDKVTRAHAAHLGLVEASAEERAFAASARAYLDQRLSILNAGKLDFDAVDEAEVRHVLDEMVHPSATEGYAAMAQQARQRAEAEALGELETDAGRRAPPLFRRFFEGDGVGGLGWYETYALFVNERIKTDERFRSVFLAAELVDIKRLVEAADRRIAALDARLSRLIEDGFARAETEAERRHREVMEALAREKGVPIPPLAAVLRRLGEADVPAEAIPARLEAAAERLLELEARLSQPSNDRPETAAARDRARKLLNAGDLDGAETALREARGALRERREQTAREEADVLRDEANIARLRLDYATEANLCQEAATVLGFDTQAASVFWMSSAEAHYRKGVEFGDLEGLRAAVDSIERQVLPRVPRDICPLRWAAAQNTLGTALAILGERGDNNALTQAINAYGLALLERTPQRAPRERGRTLLNLGNVNFTLARRGHDGALQRAIAMYHDALIHLPRHLAPFDWAMLQNNLGNALAELANQGDDSAFGKAIIAYENALLVRTRQGTPMPWAETKSNLGAVFLTLAQRGDAGAAAKAIANLKCALEERPRQRVPLLWAQTQSNLGAAFLVLGARGDDQALAEAVTCFEGALLEGNRQRTPLDWAQTQSNLGIALRLLGERGDHAAIERAMTAFNSALLVASPEGTPYLWAVIQNNLAAVWITRFERDGECALVHAITAFESALVYFKRDRAPHQWVRIQRMMGGAEMRLGDRRGDANLWHKALQRAHEALEVARTHNRDEIELCRQLEAELCARLNPPG